jgi:hypothetical protein
MTKSPLTKPLVSNMTSSCLRITFKQERKSPESILDSGDLQMNKQHFCTPTKSMICWPLRRLIAQRKAFSTRG